MTPARSARPTDVRRCTHRTIQRLARILAGYLFLFLTADATRVLLPFAPQTSTTGHDGGRRNPCAIWAESHSSSRLFPWRPTLAGGYLGEVTSVSDDGRTVWLTVAPMGAAFDLYRLTVPPFAEEAEATPAAPSSATTQSQAAPTKLEAPDEETQARQSRSGEPQADALPQAQLAASGLVECNLATSVSVTPAVNISHAGHADVTIDKYDILGVGVPTGVSFDVGYSATLSGTISIEASHAIECGLPLPNFYKQITLYPVPIGLNVRPEVEVSVSAGGSITNLGFAATAGFEVDAHMGFTGGNSFDGDVINSSSPTQPTATGSLKLGLGIGGKVAFGPGIGTSDAGVVIGVGGDLKVVDASIGVTMVDDGTNVSTCIELSAATTMGISAALRAWIPGYEADYTVPIEDLQGKFPWVVRLGTGLTTALRAAPPPTT